MNSGDKSTKAPETDVLTVRLTRMPGQLSSEESNQLTDVIDMRTANQMADALLANDQLLSRIVGS